MLAVIVASIAGCGKMDDGGSSSGLRIAISDVKAQTFLLSVSSQSKQEPALVRMIEAIPLEVILKDVKSLENTEMLKTYLTRNGKAVNLPFETLVKDLSPKTEYVVGAVAFNDAMDVISFAVETVTTKAFGETTVGDPSGAGSLVINNL